MEIRDGRKKRKTQVGEKRQNCNVESNSGSLGDVSMSSGELGNDQVGTSGTNSEERNFTSTTRGETAAGGTVSQLIQEAEEQLAHHEEQANKLKDRLQKLHDLFQVLQHQETNNSK